MSRDFLMVTPDDGLPVFKALASPARLEILKLLHASGPLNVNEIAAQTGQPQSTTSTHVQLLEDAGLIRTESTKARKGSQKVCHAVHEEVVLMLRADVQDGAGDAIEVSMPVGLYTAFEVSAPCGLCAPDGIIGYLDSADTFLNPDRMKAGLLWFNRGFVEYQFPNNARIKDAPVQALEAVMELSSEVPGTSQDWPSDISVSINGVPLGDWTSPGDFGDRQGKYTPRWWKLSGSQYGMLKSWRVTDTGTFVDGVRVSGTTLADLKLDAHRSVRMRIEVSDRAAHPGGVNIFGRGFGNHDQDIVLRFHF